jgi:SAM-dependent methyltransferase
MKDYDTFAEHYDTVVGQRRDVAAFLRQILVTFAPHAKTLLELGCGSGSMLKVLSRHYATWGVDRSSSMLSIARRKAPKARLIHSDITALDLAQRFDAIVCPFDTINHVTSLSGWRKVFRNAHSHLNRGGIFVFDVNTEAKMERYRLEPAAADMSKDAVTIVDVRRTARYRYKVMHKVFERARGNLFNLHEMEIPEFVVPTPKILAEIRPFFEKVMVVDPDRTRPSASSEELFFICRYPR